MLFVFRIEYSQSTEKTVVVEASTREKAEAFLKRHGTNGPRHVTFYGSVEKPITVLEE